jgi:outer membrane murein-binding lipoprotein Lpp
MKENQAKVDTLNQNLTELQAKNEQLTLDMTTEQ